jgi:hypothetical protein
MTTEEQILERLDRIEAQLAPVSASAKGLKPAGADETLSAQRKTPAVRP